MRLYVATQKEWVRDRPLRACQNSVCRLSGNVQPHVCATGEPVQGQGPHVYGVDVRAEEVERFEYADDFQQAEARTFAIPLSLASTLEWKREDFLELTGREWNRWEVPVWSQTSFPAEQETWGLVWSSRAGVAVAEELPDQHRFESRVRLTLTEEFNTDEDYLLLETHERGLSGSEQESHAWGLTLLAGVVPSWGAYPCAWSAWVQDEKVVQSAIEYILNCAPSVGPSIAFARSLDSRLNRMRGWRLVAQEVGSELGRDLGSFSDESAAAVDVIPITLATRIAQDSPYGAWEPPRPKPQYENPDRSGRVLLANQCGAYPTHGPGVDAPTVIPYRAEPGSNPQG